MDSLKPEVAAVFRTVITGDRRQINQAINNYRDPNSTGYHRCYLYQEKDSDGRNLLHYVCMYNTDEVATWMLLLEDETGSSLTFPKISDNFGATAVMYAASTRKFTFLKACKQGFDVKNKDKEGRNILNYFCGTGQTIPERDNQAARLQLNRDQARLAHFLIEKGFSFYAVDPDGMIPFKIYTETNFNKCLYLNQSDADEAQKSWKEVYKTISVILTGQMHSPTLPEPSSLKVYGGLMHTAVALCFMYHVATGIKQRVENFEEKITFGKLDVNETDGDGMTALHHLCYYKYENEPYGLRDILVAKLLELGADPNAEDIWMRTPLMCAIENGYVINDGHQTAEQQRMGKLLKTHVAFQIALNKEEAKEIIQDMKENMKEMNQVLSELKAEVKKQTKEISKLKLQKDNKRELERVMDDAPTSSLLLGNVALTNVCRHLETDVEVTCLPDASFEDLQAVISKDNQKYKNIYLVTGNRASGSYEDIDRKEQYKELLKAAKTKCTEVKISSVLPVMEDEDVTDKIKEINKILEGFCQQAGCVFVDNDRTFKYQDGSINEACFHEEGEHLSEFGIKRLLKNLGLLAVKKKTQATNI